MEGSLAEHTIQFPKLFETTLFTIIDLIPFEFYWSHILLALSADLENDIHVGAQVRFQQMILRTWVQIKNMFLIFRTSWLHHRRETCLEYCNSNCISATETGS